MAEGIENLVGDEVTVRTMPGHETEGTLRGSDEKGILVSRDSPEEDAVRVFFPWSRIEWVRAAGGHESPAAPGSDMYRNAGPFSESP